MTWIFSGDDVPREGVPNSPVGDHETVARLLHSTLVPFGKKSLRRSDIFPEPRKKGEEVEVCNTVGKCTGLSVDRSGNLSDEEIWRRSEAIAGENRTAEGARLASVDVIRAARVPHDERQIAFVYADPIVGAEGETENAEHAVVRGNDQFSVAQRDEVRATLEDCFNRDVPKLQPGQ